MFSWKNNLSKNRTFFVYTDIQTSIIMSIILFLMFYGY